MMGERSRLGSRAPPSESAPTRPRFARTGRHRSLRHGRLRGRSAHHLNASSLVLSTFGSIIIAIALAATSVVAGGDAVPDYDDGRRAPTTLRIFLLAGQSNMEGHGFVHAPPPPPHRTTGVDGAVDPSKPPSSPLNGTLEWQLHVDHTHLPICRTMRTPPAGTHCRAEGADFTDLYDPDAEEWRKFPGVYVAFKGSSVDRHGPLSVGYGLKEWWIGPEYGFGRTLGRRYHHDKNGGDDGDVLLLLKVAWGGTDLEYDWRSPRSGKPPPPSPKHGPRPNWAYRNFTSIVRSVLAHDLEDLVPTFSYGRGDRYELSGLGWHQGWNDGCSETEVRDYGENLANLIKDLRDEFDDLHAPADLPLPVVIGTSGFGGWDEVNPRRLGIMKAQYGASLRDDLVPGTVAAVDTRGFWRPYEETHGAANQCYHWYGNGETYYHVGTAMGEAMVRLLDGTWRQPPMHDVDGPAVAVDSE